MYLLYKTFWHLTSTVTSFDYRDSVGKIRNGWNFIKKILKTSIGIIFWATVYPIFSFFFGEEHSTPLGTKSIAISLSRYAGKGNFSFSRKGAYTIPKEKLKVRPCVWKLLVASKQPQNRNMIFTVGLFSARWSTRNSNTELKPSDFRRSGGRATRISKVCRSSDARFVSKAAETRLCCEIPATNRILRVKRT